MIKPNIDELVSTFGCKKRDLETVRKVAKEIIKKYSVSIVCVSIGQEGAYIASSEEEYFCPAYKINARASQGAGDSMIAGICYAMQNGYSLSEMISFGSAVAAASVSKDGTGFCTKEEIDVLLDQNVKVVKL